jgi:hypothetical protein
MNEKVSIIENIINEGISPNASSWKKDSNLKGAFFSYENQVFYLKSEEIYSSKIIKEYLKI